MKSSSTKKVKALIIGGGLAGVSTAALLPANDSLLVEREKELGGTARSFEIDGFTFDFTGHLLHLHHPTTKKLIPRLLKGNMVSRNRKAWIFSHDVSTRYPFQANTFGLPDPVVQECVLTFLEAAGKKPKQEINSLNFEQWCRAIFGDGIFKHFMMPYNEKIFQTKPRQLTVDWCGQFVPKVELDDVVRGALIDQPGKFGYNTQFIYPKRGGIQVLSQALGQKLKNVRLSTSLVKLNTQKRLATLSDGSVVQYSHLVNTMPLPLFLNLIDKLPPSIQMAKRKLKAVGILCLNVGVNRPNISKASWIYFPEPHIPFYRVGFPMNFTPHTVPKNCSSMYIEIPLSLANRTSPRKLIKDVKKHLVRARILRSSDQWLVTQFLPIPTAYVIYDRFRQKSLETIVKFLSDHKIQSIGRYGAWKYSFMEEAILDGRNAAEKIHGQTH